MKVIDNIKWFEEAISCPKCKSVLIYSSEDKHLLSLGSKESVYIICIVCGQEIYIKL